MQVATTYLRISVLFCLAFSLGGIALFASQGGFCADLKSLEGTQSLPAADSQLELVSELESQSQAKAQSLPAADSQLESVPGPESQSQLKAQSQPGAQSQLESVSEPESQSQTKAQPQLEAQPHVEPPEAQGAASTESTIKPAVTHDETSVLPEIIRIQGLEEKLFSRAFTLDPTVDRLARLEKFVFGVESKGDTKARLDKLNKVFSKTASAVPLAAIGSSSVNAAGTTSASANAAGTTSASANAVTPASATAAARKKNEMPKALLSMINQGIDNYNKHRFHNAEDDFNDALSLAPGMSRIHVYLGSTLLQLNQRQSALDAMNAAYELDPFGTYGRYAKHCLITLMGDEEIRKRGPKDDVKTVQKTLDIVNKQADLDAQRHRDLGEAISLTRVYATPRRDPGLDPSESRIRQSLNRSDGYIQQLHARQDAAQRALNTQDAANNLKALITTKVMPGDAKLRAFGTTLNARYYGDETYNLAPWYIPREAPLELKAQSLMLKAKPRSPKSPAYAKALVNNSSHYRRKKSVQKFAQKKSALKKSSRRR